MKKDIIEMNDVNKKNVVGCDWDELNSEGKKEEVLDTESGNNGGGNGNVDDALNSVVSNSGANGGSVGSGEGDVLEGVVGNNIHNSSDFITDDFTSGDFVENNDELVCGVGNNDGVMSFGSGSDGGDVFNADGDVVGGAVKVKKGLQNILYLYYPEFVDFEKLDAMLSREIAVNNQYSIMCRFSFGIGSNVEEHEWRMLGNQIPLCVLNRMDFESEFYAVYKILQDQLKKRLDNYKFTINHLSGFQILIYCVGYVTSRKLIKKFDGQGLGESKDLINVSKTVNVINKLIPLNNQYEKWPGLLEKKVFDNKVVSIKLLNGGEIDILEFVNKYLPLAKKKQFVLSDRDFYQVFSNNTYYIISVYARKNLTYIDVYNEFGFVVDNFWDQVLDVRSFVRYSGNVRLFIDITGIYKRDIQVKFKPITNSIKINRKSKSRTGLQPEWKIGTFDIETFRLTGDVKRAKVYAIGFYIKNSVNIFYIDDKLNYDEFIINVLDKMLVEKYNGYSFYCHNFHGYDSCFILGYIFDIVRKYPNIYKYDCRFNDSKLLRLTISKKVVVESKNNKVYTKSYSIRFVDSLFMLSRSLEELCLTFNPDVKKSRFPYTFVNENTLFYKGVKPALNYFNISPYEYKKLVKENRKLGIRTLSLEQSYISKELYDSIPLNNWDLKEETIKYLENDLISLYKVIEIFSLEIFANHHVHVVDSLTISSLSLNIYLSNYYSNNIPLINTKSVYNNIKQSYYGGITEVYIPHGKNLYYYDVNSLYPFAALNLMPGLNAIYEDDINTNIKDMDLDDFFGFFKCKIKAPDGYFGLLPCRTKEGLISPTGEWEGWYFSEELKAAFEQGYEIEVLLGYNFDTEKNVFQDYINTLYDIKCTTTDPVIRAIAKDLLNHVLGRLGLNINKFETLIVSEHEHIELQTTRECRGFKYLDNDLVLCQYNVDVSKYICEKYGRDYEVEFMKNTLKGKGIDKDKFNDVSVAISSAITSYARIYMNKIKLEIHKKGGKVYYTDTDSIVTDIKLDDSLVSSKKLGLLKLEYEIEEAYFLSSKTYVLILKNGEVITINKGSDTSELTPEDYRKVYNGETIQTVRYESIKDFKNRSVILREARMLELTTDSYTKRKKVFDKVWIDTKPWNFSDYVKHNNKRLGSDGINNERDMSSSSITNYEDNNLNIIKNIDTLDNTLSNKDNAEKLHKDKDDTSKLKSKDNKKSLMSLILLNIYKTYSYIKKVLDFTFLLVLYGVSCYIEPEIVDMLYNEDFFNDNNNEYMSGDNREAYYFINVNNICNNNLEGYYNEIDCISPLDRFIMNHLLDQEIELPKSELVNKLKTFVDSFVDLFRSDKYTHINKNIFNNKDMIINNTSYDKGRVIPHLDGSVVYNETSINEFLSKMEGISTEKKIHKLNKRIFELVSRESELLGKIHDLRMDNYKKFRDFEIRGNITIDLLNNERLKWKNEYMYIHNERLKWENDYMNLHKELYQTKLSVYSLSKELNGKLIDINMKTNINSNSINNQDKVMSDRINKSGIPLSSVDHKRIDSKF